MISDLGFRTQALDSPSAKAAYGLDRDENGVLVIKVFEGLSRWHPSGE